MNRVDERYLVHASRVKIRSRKEFSIVSPYGGLLKQYRLALSSVSLPAFSLPALSFVSARSL